MESGNGICHIYGFFQNCPLELLFEHLTKLLTMVYADKKFIYIELTCSNNIIYSQIKNKLKNLVE